MREMLNIEKYKEELIKMGVININMLAIEGNKPAICNDNYKIKGITCIFCGFKPDRCADDATSWLFSEYKEPKVDWSQVKVGTPILVRDDEDSDWNKRYFAGFKNRRVYAWMNGATSWLADSECSVNSWKYAKLAESDEIDNDGWILCNERLPETFEQKVKAYLTTNKEGMIGVSYYHHGWSNGYESVFDVIAWQPLPEPYREEK